MVGILLQRERPLPCSVVQWYLAIEQETTAKVMSSAHKTHFTTYTKVVVEHYLYEKDLHHSSGHLSSDTYGPCRMTITKPKS